MSTPSPKLALFAQFALVAKTLGHPQRLELIEQLGQGPRSVDLLAEKLGIPCFETPTCGGFLSRRPREDTPRP